MAQQLNATRVLVAALRAYAEARGLRLRALCHDWLFRLEDGQRAIHVFGYDLGLNDSAASRIAQDKSATAELLQACDVAAVPHRLFMSPALARSYLGQVDTWRAMREQFEQWRGRVVLKPNDGTSGHDVQRAFDVAALQAAAHELFARHRAIAMSPWLDIAAEHRFVILDDAVLLHYEKHPSHVVGDGRRTLAELAVAAALPVPEEDAARVPAAGERVPLGWKHNLAQGASLQLCEPPPPAAALARAAARCIGLRFCSVDVARTAGEFLVMEVNAGVMLEHAARLLPDGEALARGIYFRALDARWQQGERQP